MIQLIQFVVQDVSKKMHIIVARWFQIYSEKSIFMNKYLLSNASR